MHLAVPGRSANVEKLTIEVNIAPLQTESLAGTESFKSKDREKSVPRLFSEGEYFLNLIDCEVWGLESCVSWREMQLARVDLLAGVAPIAGR